MKIITARIAAALAASASFAAINTSATYADDGQLTLEEIIVTAQKREQSLQDVPISVATLDGESFKQLVAAGEDIRVLAGRIPGLNAESSNGRTAPRFYIRGLGNTDFDLAASQPVSIIMDDVVMERVSLKSFPLFDVARVEVLRGPQGTLFGRNTPAGIVKFDSVKPGDEAEGYVVVNYGTHGTASVEAAITTPINEVVSIRTSGLYSTRDDWIDNGYTNEKNAMGGFEDIAARVFVSIKPSDNFEALLKVHARDLDGTASIFRANILTTGSNELNENYDRDTVWYDGGDNNPQGAKQDGASLKLVYNTDLIEFTSITAVESATGSSFGDIDGGFGAGDTGGPGFIPFPSATAGIVDDLDQFTQEVRLASNSESIIQWQAGAYYFKDDLTATTDPGFVDPTSVFYDNEAWSVFGQASHNINDKTTITGGMRYTKDKKNLNATVREVISVPAFGFSFINTRTFTENVDASRISWDLAVNHVLNDDISVFARIADGFRAPSIQGRNLAFPPNRAASVAKEETIRSYEAGFKSELLENTLRLNGTAFYWRMQDQQLSAVGGTGNLIRLVNADTTTGYGMEFDMEWLVSENFSLTAGLSWNNTQINDTDLAVATCGSGQCTPLDPESTTNPGFVSVDKNSLPQAPDIVANFNATYIVPLGDAQLAFSTDWFIENDKHLFLYESAEYQTSGDFEGGFRVAYQWGEGNHELALFGRNITDEDNLKGGIDFNNNTAFVNEPRRFGISFRSNF